MPVIFQDGQLLQGSNTTLPKVWSGGKAAKWAFQGMRWNWSNIKFDGTESSFCFIPDPDGGGMQGDLSIGTGSATSTYPNKVGTYDHSNIRYEIDPAGGTGSFNILSRDLSYWHKIGPILYSYQYTSEGNDMTFIECQFDIKGCTDLRYGEYTQLTTGNTGRELKRRYVINLSTTDDTTDSTFLPTANSDYDLTINYKIGPNNTSESSYLDLYLIGFINEKKEEEYFSRYYSYSSYKNVPWKHNGTYIDSARTTPEQFTWYEFELLKLWQKPNVLYGVHIKFINPQYADYDTAPPASMVLESNSVPWNTRIADILIYVEFGISPDGGQTMWWNGVESDSTIGGDVGAELVASGITSVVPDDINKYMTASLLNNSCKPNSTFDGYSPEPRYTVHMDTATVHGTKGFKFVRMKITTDTDNDEANNIPKDRYQHYAPINFEDMATTTTDGKRLSQYYAKAEANSQSCVKFQIGRKYKTNAWSTTVQVKLNYQKDSLKFIGSTSD